MGNIFQDIIQHNTNAASERARRQVQQGSGGTIITTEEVNPYGIVEQRWTDAAGTSTFQKLYGSAIPASGTYQVGDVIINSAPSRTAPVMWVCTTAGTSGTWVPILPVTISSDQGDANVTWMPGSSFPILRFATTLTANRTVTVNTTGAVNGMTLRVVRSGLGSFTLTVQSSSSATLKVLPSATAAWADFAYSSTINDWVETASGTL
jgi:hypothetical protein